MSPTYAKSNFIQRLVDGWPVLVAVIGFCATIWFQTNMLEYRMNNTERDVAALREDFKKNLETMTNAIKELQLDVRTLVTIAKEKHNESVWEK